MDAPKIVTGKGDTLGIPLDVFADVDETQFPLGIEIILCKPGDIQPLGKGMIPVGCMLACIPAEVAAHIRQHVRSQQKFRPLEPGEVDAPGIKG